MEKFFIGVDNNGLVMFNPVFASLEPYSIIWEADKSKEKIAARKKLSYIWCMCSLDKSTNTFCEIDDKYERHRAVVTDLYGEDDKYNPATDPLIIKGMEKYRERTPKNAYDIQAEFKVKVIDELRATISALDFSEKADNGTLAVSPKSIADTTSAMDRMVDELEKLKEKAQELRETAFTRIRGGGEVTLFEKEEMAKQWLENKNGWQYD